VVDLTRDAPVGGDYAEVSAMGLIWASNAGAVRANHELFADDVMQPLQTLLCETAAGDRAEVTI
jgi:hypothetical protein